MLTYYPSNIVGSKIVNAVTGKSYDYLVGSKEETNFYRVIDSTGNYDMNGKYNKANRTPNKLFFNDEQQYLDFVKLSRNILEKRSKKTKVIKEIMNEYT